MNQSLIHYLREHPKIHFLGIGGLTIGTVALTLIPSDFLNSSPIWSFDKLGHILLFGSWTFLLGLYRMMQNSRQNSVWPIFLAGLVFGGAIELLQYLLPFNRTAELLDLACDSVGALAAVLLLKVLFKSSDSDSI